MLTDLSPLEKWKTIYCFKSFIVTEFVLAFQTSMILIVYKHSVGSHRTKYYD